MTPLAVSGFLISFTCFLLAGATLAASPYASVNRLMAAFNFAVAIWGGGTFFAGFSATPLGALWAWRIGHVGGFFLGIVFFHLVTVLAKHKRSRIVKLNYVFAAISSLLAIGGQAIAGTERLFVGFYYYQANILYGVLFLIWTGIVLWGHILLYQSYRAARGLERKQLRLIFLALATGFLGGITVLLPPFGLRLYPYGNFAIPVYCAIATYAIIRYGIGDLRIILTRASLLLGVYLVALGLPFLIGGWSAKDLEQILGPQWWLAPLCLSTALAAAAPFAYSALRKRAEDALLKEQRRYQRTLQRASRGMTQVRNVQRLANLITRVVSGSVRMTHASLFLYDKSQHCFLLQASHGHQRLAVQSRYGLETNNPLIGWLVNERRVLVAGPLDKALDPALAQELKRLNAVLVIPGLIERRLIGFLVLGAKHSGVSYSLEDLHAFTTLANEAAIAIENAMSYEELLKVNEQLKAASERLLRQERLAAAGQFATGMMHEIKNPLSAIKTFAQYLPERYQEPEFREKFFRIVQAEIERINDIVRELSDFAKPARPVLQSVELTEIVRDTLTLLSEQSLKQGVTLRQQSSLNGARVAADPQQLKQVILNLLLNSLEALDGKAGTIVVESNLADNFAMLRVIDSGPGIPAARQQQVWDPFFTTKERGMGLGLAIVKGIVERHGGRIQLISTSGQGTTVEVSIPIAS